MLGISFLNFKLKLSTAHFQKAKKLNKYSGNLLPLACSAQRAMGGLCDWIINITAYNDGMNMGNEDDNMYDEDLVDDEGSPPKAERRIPKATTSKQKTVSTNYRNNAILKIYQNTNYLPSNFFRCEPKENGGLSSSRLIMASSPYSPSLASSSIMMASSVSISETWLAPIARWAAKATDTKF